MMKQVEQQGCKVTITFETEDEARTYAPALHAVLQGETLKHRLTFKPPLADKAKGGK